MKPDGAEWLDRIFWRLFDMDTCHRLPHDPEYFGCTWEACETIGRLRRELSRLEVKENEKT